MPEKYPGMESLHICVIGDEIGDFGLPTSFVQPLQGSINLSLLVQVIRVALIIT